MRDYPTRQPIQVMIVAVSPALRAGLRTLLERPNQIEISAEARSLRELPAPLLGSVVLVIAGEQFTTQAELEELQHWDERIALLFLADRGEELLGNLISIKNHAWGILPIESSAEEMLAAITALNQGLIVGSPHLLGAAYLPEVRATHQDELDFEQEPNQTLTEREIQVLQLLGQGMANKQIALRLVISEHTVKFHISAIYQKLGVSNRTEAVRAGVRRGFISL